MAALWLYGMVVHGGGLGKEASGEPCWSGEGARVTNGWMDGGLVDMMGDERFGWVGSEMRVGQTRTQERKQVSLRISSSTDFPQRI